MKVMFAEHMNQPKVEVEAEKTKIKGYSGFDFFIFKHVTIKKWFVCEYLTGLVIGQDKLKAEAKKAARIKLNEEVNKDKVKLQNIIDKKEFINSVILDV